MLKNLLYTVVLIVIISQVKYSATVDFVKSNFLNFSETNPKLKLLKYEDTLGSSENVTTNGSHYLMKTIFNQLTFECESTLPVRWSTSLRWGDSCIDKIEIEKGRIVKNDGQQLFNSTIHFRFKEIENLMNLTCRNLCSVLGNNGVNKTICKQTSFVFDDFKKIEGHFPAQVNAYIVHDNSKDENKTVQLKPAVKEKEDCSYTMNVDLSRAEYSCCWHNRLSEKPLLTGSSIVRCRNPDECNNISPNDESCHQLLRNTTCSDDFHSIKIPSTPFAITCGSESKLTRVFFQPYQHFIDGRREGRKLSLYNSKTRKELLEQNKEAVGGVNIEPLDKNIPLSQTCQQNLVNDTNVTLPICQGESRNFTCSGLKSFYTYGFIWALRYSDGRREELGHGEFGDNSTDEAAHICRSNKVINITGNVTEVICAAPRWNSLEWTNYTLRLHVMKPTRPMRKEGKNETRLTQGEHHLDCLVANAWPPATYIWKFNDAILSPKRLQNFSITLKENHLNLSSSSFAWKSRRFVISCHAMNLAGETVTNFVFEQNEDGSFSSINWGLLSGLGLVLFILIFILIFAFIKIRKQKEELCLTDVYLQEFQNGSPDGPDPLILPYNTNLEIPRENIILGDKILGSGAYGKVIKGKAGIMTVAIKTLNKSADITYLKALMSEIKVMSFVNRHPSIVNLVGACTENIRKREIFVVLEYCEQGDMLSLLRRCRGIFVNYLQPEAVESERRSFVEYQNASVKKLSTKDIMSWASDIASGMEWISNKNVIHGDLAARNVLITMDLNAKVSDFGLSKQLPKVQPRQSSYGDKENYSIYVQKLEVPLPLRWMAYESLKDLEFSIQSDIWSFGVVLWEIFSLGDLPYPGTDWGFNSWELLENGERMEKPKYATDYLYTLMCETWSLDPRARPSFKFLKENINRHLLNVVSKETLNPTRL